LGQIFIQKIPRAQENERKILYAFWITNGINARQGENVQARLPPQRPQKRMFAGKTLPHTRQTRSACGGRFCIVRGAAVAGAGRFSPQRPQKREFGGKAAEHRGQGNDPGSSPGLTRINDRFPQRPQNLAPSANREPHLVHATMPGITLE
jgi:hypothetical protein